MTQTAGSPQDSAPSEPTSAAVPGSAPSGAPTTELEAANPVVSDSAEAEIESWVRLAIDGAEEKLGRETVAFYVGDVFGVTDWFVITSGSSGRQVRAIVEGVEEMVTVGDGPKPLRIEGKDAPDWVLMDYGTFIVHVFTDEAREFYDLERLWSDVPQLVRSEDTSAS